MIRLLSSIRVPSLRNPVRLPARRDLHSPAPPIVVLLSLGVLGLVGLLDYVMPLSVELLYLGPIVWSTWGGGRWAGRALAVLSAGVLLLVDVLTGRYPDFLVPFWNALVTLGIFLIVTQALATALALAQQRLQQETERAELLARTDTLKTTLLQMVSHDLRTPLASIKAAATSLLDPEVAWEPGIQRTLLEGIDEQCDRLTRLVSNLLDLSRIESGVLRLECDWYNLAEVVNLTRRQLQLPLAHHVVTLDLPPDLPLLWIDFTRVEQILINLLGNAAKYTPPGTEITVRAEVRDQEIAVTVADYGPGVAPTDLPQLFDKFNQIRISGQPPSTGLGLSIVQGLVQAHGGHVTARSTLGDGLQITFTLPLRHALAELARLRRNDHGP